MNIAKDVTKLLDKCTVCEIRRTGWKINAEDCENCPVEAEFKELRKLLVPRGKTS